MSRSADSVGTGILVVVGTAVVVVALGGVVAVVVGRVAGFLVVGSCVRVVESSETV